MPVETVIVVASLLLLGGLSGFGLARAFPVRERTLFPAMRFPEAETRLDQRLRQAGE